MFQKRQQMWISSCMTQLPPQQLKHGGRALSVDVLLVEPSSELPLIFIAHHLEELDVPIQRLVFVFSKFLDHCNFVKI